MSSCSGLMALAAPPWVDAPSALHQWLESPLVKAPLPVPVFFLLAPLMWLLFRGTWKQLDVEAQKERGHRLAMGKWDARPAVACVIMAVVLTLQEYYGGGRTYQSVIRPFLMDQQDKWLSGVIDMAKYDNLYSYAWWSFARVLGYVLIPLPLWKILFPRDSLLDMGFRVSGFFRHVWIYGVSLAVVIPAMFLVARQPDFGTYYPFYKLASRSWFDLMAWEVMYFAQFLALEIFFRGWFLGALRRTVGAAAIFVMAMPYCMIHYGKPYLEAHGAIIAGIFLGSLSMKTRSIYAGFLVHITVALSMDLLSLFNRDALPTKWMAP
ncbi:MAG TPA: type II CAAX endopeptidase family protein [Polyangiaceae bacterium]|nr:MAG: CAAX amino terminal protease self- immunity [Deltaproteobacteria bacterium ADurb.Bin207]HNS96516.1 type II CAAX endopeptidase family protein [Polyangiaceae bacterium]HNZ24043.1 type II CAAX endopeptidase family protein [Polyangiaceae bacterium]HOD21834.1 type II CAAX endopeptidase family protein [Polyangiaceae bacterium]HOE49900.1 type II CAAX endopeptidase family protein [Polyangiaceae bacterium]